MSVLKPQAWADMFGCMRSKLAILKFIPFYFSLELADKMEFVAWWRRNFVSPAPQFIKMRILQSAKNVDVWIETGTYMGRTTDFLRQIGSSVVSIEASKELALKAERLFERHTNVQIVYGLSEDELEKILEGLGSEVRRIAFWLDGHFSGGPTHLGPVETPIQKELEIISRKLKRFDEVSLFIDDFRCFVKQETDYPGTEILSCWARENNLSWSVEHDIFIARTRT
jgi:DNA helicase HerA-like ATPase